MQTGTTGKRAELEAALAKAEAELARAVGGAGAAAGTTEVDINIEKARARCRHLRAGLAGSNGEHPTQAVEPLAADAEKPAREPFKSRPGARKTARDFIRGFSARTLDAAGWRLLIRQSLALLALVLAYLQYYFLDVQLQVVRLPSVTVILFG